MTIKSEYEIYKEKYGFKAMSYQEYKKITDFENKKLKAANTLSSHQARMIKNAYNNRKTFYEKR